VAARHEILRLLGRGGMGAVYQARDRTLDGEIIALKLLRQDMPRTEEMRQRFRSEIRLARRVLHRNVCRMHDYGEDGPLRFITMEYVNGVDLRDVIGRSPALTPGQVYDLCLQAAEGLRAVHDASIIHRDLKTANMMLDSRGVLRLMDFGIAKDVSADNQAGPTKTGHLVGTPEYMSPEQIRGEPIDQRTDIYSLGVIIFQLFTGRLPFKGDTPVVTIYQQLQTPPPLSGDAAAQIPEPIRVILAKALQKERAYRYPNVEAMLSDLNAAGAAIGVARITGDAGAARARADNEPTIAMEGARNEGEVTTASRRLVSSRTGVVAAVLVALAAVAAWRGTTGATPEPRVAVPRTTPTMPPPSTILPPSAAPAVAPATVAARTPLAVRTKPAPRANGVATSIPTDVPATASPVPTAAPVAAGTGTLHLVVLPPAEVEIDERRLGTVDRPLDVDLPEGVHRVTLRHERFEPWHRSVEIRAQRTTSLIVDLREQAVPRR